MDIILGKTLDKIEDIFAVIAGLLLLVSLFSIMLEVVVRYLSGSSFTWVQEYNEYLLLYIPFLAGAWLLRNNDHVVVNLIDNLLGERSAVILNSIVAILGALAMVIVVYYSTIVTVDIFERGVTSTTVLRTPQTYVYVIIPIGSFIMLLEFIRQLFKTIKSKNESF